MLLFSPLRVCFRVVLFCYRRKDLDPVLGEHFWSYIFYISGSGICYVMPSFMDSIKFCLDVINGGAFTPLAMILVL